MARFDLGLSDAEFLRETPYSLDLLMERAKHADFKHFMGFAKVMSLYANVHRDEKKRKKPFTEFDFMPPYLVPNDKRQKKVLGRRPNETDADMRARVRKQINGIFSKKVAVRKDR